MSAERPSSLTRYITPDGRLTVEGLKFFEKMVAEIRRLEALIDAHHP